MKLENTQFAELISNVPTINIELEWDGDEGRKEIEAFELNCGKYLVFADFTVTESGKSDNGDYYNPPSFTSYGKMVHDVNVEVYTEDDAEEIELTREQEMELAREIEKCLI